MCPHVLNQIILEMNMFLIISHLDMKLGELCKRSRYMLRHNSCALVLEALLGKILWTLILYDHVVHDHTSSHHLSHLL